RPGPAVFRGHRQALPAHSREALPDLTRDAARAVHFADAFFRELALEEGTDALAQHLVLRNAVEVQPPFFQASRISAPVAGHTPRWRVMCSRICSSVPMR